MAAWIGPYWQQEERQSLTDDEEVSRHRMVELLLGPFLASKTSHVHHLVNEQLTTLDLLPTPSNSFPPLRDAIGCTHIELEPEMPLPSGWEKCLNLKTGSIYYLNRSTGATSSCDPRKQSSLDKACGKNDASTSPASSELTVEASNEAFCNNRKAKQQSRLDVNEEPKSANSNGESDLDLNLTLHVGLCSSPMATASNDAGALTLQVSNPAASPAVIIKACSNASVSSASSSSTSSPSTLSASMAFSQTILSSKELSQPPFPDVSTLLNKQERNQAIRRRSHVYAGTHHSLFEHAPNVSGITPQRLAESEDLTAPAAMVTAACANCLMFVMLSRSNPRCPRCGTSCPEQVEALQPSLKRAKLGFSF
ncbi:hypothetical protein L7F22_064745 [Adiantum nelumboides]|nr:hypothetical protein [Adiantum nelumboides]MCO5610506.1 hypothetical protein [Adiantum nelumboides]